MPVQPAEYELSVMVHPGFLQQAERPKAGEGEMTGKRFRVIIEIDQGAHAMPGFDITVGMSVKRSGEGTFFYEADEIFREYFRLEMDDRSGFGGGEIPGVTNDEYVLVLVRLQGIFIGGYKAQVILLGCDSR